jgi:cardiolipin synthase
MARVKLPRRFFHPAVSTLTTSAISCAATILISRNFFATGKKIKHRIVSDYKVGSPTFTRTVGNLLGPPLLEGNRVTLLQNGKEIFPAMIEAIRAAERTITFENFVFSEGRVSDAFAEALAERARAGVKVHFLQDALGSDCLRGRAMNRMRAAGVEIEIFRFFEITQINFRTHRKLLVIDGKVGFIGGVAICDAWEGDGQKAGNWRDTQYRIEGPVVAQAQQAFMENWMQTRAAVLHGDAYFPELPPVGDDLCHVFKSSADEGSDSARLMFLLSIAAAQHSIRIANAYFLPDDLCRQTLVEACQRGVQVEIVTSGPDTDQTKVRKVGRARWRPLLEAGARFYEYQPARFHCKYMIVDDCWCSVGSCNLDNRSLRLNEEANLNILDKSFSAKHLEAFQQDKARSREITFDEWRHRPLSEKAIGRIGSLFRTQI